MLITNYITSAWRNILRHKLFSIINILGLAIGLAAVMLIALYVRYETSYDSFWKNADNIYRMQKTVYRPGQSPHKALTFSNQMIDAFLNNSSEVKNSARLWPQVRSVTYGEKSFQQFMSLVDPAFIEILDFNPIAGNLEEAFSTTNGIILNETEANKYFGTKDPIGEIITINYGQFVKDHRVTAIIEDLPENSMMNLPIMAPLIRSEWENTNIYENWFASMNYFIFSTNDNADIENINAKMPQIIDDHYNIYKNFPGKRASEILEIKSVNIKDLHLKAEGDGELRPEGSYTSVLLFSVTSILILIIASINFMNLSTARATLRAKEVGLRKTVGATRKNLIFQFIGESISYSLIAFLIALCLVEVSLPFFNEYINYEYTSIELTLDYVSLEMLVFSGITILVGLIAGIYPAFVLSNFRPINTLKANQSTNTTGTTKIKDFLVIIQFCISIILFVASAVIYSQMSYIRNLDAGFDKENLITIDTYSLKDVQDQKEVIEKKLLTLPNVTGVTTSSITPGSESIYMGELRTPDHVKEDTTDVFVIKVDYNFFSTYGIGFLAGRDFDKGRTDGFPPQEDLVSGKRRTASIIVNQSALKLFDLGTEKEAIGKKLLRNLSENRQLEYTIIGVTPDVYFEDLREQVRPEVYWLENKQFREISIRFTGNPNKTLKETETLMTDLFPGSNFYTQLLDDKMLRQYESEQNQMTMFAAFSGLAIFIACLGLFGLASFTAERRTKEIGIRKVFGAEVWQIVKLLVWQFSKPVLIANVIAWPIAYLAMSRWLESFVYRIDDMVIIALCLVAGLSALLIAWATVAGNSYAVARQNPIKALRYE